jgi:hypothetical protein
MRDNNHLRPGYLTAGRVQFAKHLRSEHDIETSGLHISANHRFRPGYLTRNVVQSARLLRSESGHFYDSLLS